MEYEKSVDLFYKSDNKRKIIRFEQGLIMRMTPLFAIVLGLVLISVVAQAARVNGYAANHGTRVMQSSSCTPTPAPTPGE